MLCRWATFVVGLAGGNMTDAPSD
eukprot:SAG11_NODE_6755_length_1253_cov_2.154246_2_plen_23_part_01